MTAGSAFAQEAADTTQLIPECCWEQITQPPFLIEAGLPILILLVAPIYAVW